MSHKLVGLRCVLILDGNSFNLPFFNKIYFCIRSDSWYNFVQHLVQLYYCFIPTLASIHSSASIVSAMGGEHQIMSVYKTNKKIGRKQNQRKVKRVRERESAVSDSSSTVASWRIIDNKVKLKIHN